MGTVALYGAGAMGEALLAGLLDGRDAADVVITEKRAGRADELRERFGVRVLDQAEAAREADIVLVVVKPYDVVPLLEDIADELRDDALVLSFAAGITTATLEGALRPGTAVVRIMPNTPALVGQGMFALSPGSACPDERLAEAKELVSGSGRAVVVPESQQDAVTGVSGSGPAYVFHVIEAMIEAGVGQGLPRDVATELTVQTVLGAATLLRESGQHPSLLREQVTSPGGTTAAGLAQLDAHGVRSAFAAAVGAAARRSAELSGD
ncbi:pyrroline-5-carboxylate reductase [Janibacter sp. G1551]|uniref:pyrroline-5-carboxylate reductase n=1 Tax=Janibacter sp. G1551 TaxID=3420440 RepID=UPI003D06156C